MGWRHTFEVTEDLEVWWMGWRQTSEVTEDLGGRGMGGDRPPRSRKTSEGRGPVGRAEGGEAIFRNIQIRLDFSSLMMYTIHILCLWSRGP